MKIKVIFVLVVFLIIGCSTGLKLVSPTLDPQPSDPSQTTLIREGISLHDQGNFNGAIVKYKEALNLNPQNVWALYEMAFTFSAIKEYDKSIEACSEALKYKSPYLPHIYVQLGTSYDNKNEPKKAVSVYKKGVELYPENYLLHFNLGVTQLNLKNTKEAKESFKKSAMLKPDHASSHMALGEIYFNENYKIPSLLAYFRFLILEPISQRCSSAISNIQTLMAFGVEAKDESLKEINLFISPDTPTDDGDFGSVDLGLTMSRALRFTEDSKGKSELELLKSEIESMFQIMYELSENENYEGFGWEYYAPYFIELKQKGYVDPFINHIFSASNLPEINEWIDSNKTDYQEFLDWSKEFKFINQL